MILFIKKTFIFDTIYLFRINYLICKFNYFYEIQIYILKGIRKNARQTVLLNFLLLCYEYNGNFKYNF